MQRLARSSGQLDPRLRIEWPPGGAELWRVFTELGRSSGMGGPSPITMTELDAWQRVNGLRLTAWEVEILRAFDAAYMEAMRKAKR